MTNSTMIYNGKIYTRFTITFNNGDQISTEPPHPADATPVSAVITADHVHVTWSDGDISRYPDRNIAAFIAYNPHKTEQS